MTGAMIAAAGSKGIPFTATMVPQGANQAGPSSTHTFAISVTVAGGSGSYSYNWVIDGEFGDFGTGWSLSAPTSHSTNLTATGAGSHGGTAACTVDCTVTDLVTGKAAGTLSNQFTWVNNTGGL